MTEITDTLGLLRREVRDARAIASNVDIKLTRLLEGDTRSRREGSLVARLAACQLLATLDRRQPGDVAKQAFAGDRDLSRLIEIRSATGPAITTQATWAAELIGTTVADISNNLLPHSAFVQLRNMGVQFAFSEGALVRVPSHVAVPTGSFVLEGAPIPFSALLLSAITLRPKKASGLTAVTRELLAGSAANVATSLRVLLEQDLGLLVDSLLVSNTVATSAAPGGILAGATPITPTPNTGGSVNALLGDLRALMNAIAPAAKPVLLMNATQATVFGVLAYPYLPMITSPAIPANSIVAIDAASFVSSIGIPSFDTSSEAALHMENTTPLPISSGPQGSAVLAAPTSSMWQAAATSLRSILEIDWGLRRPNAAAIVTGCTW